MPLELDPNWEYWDGGDIEIQEILAREQGGLNRFDLLGIELDDDSYTGARHRSGMSNSGIRFGTGNPNSCYLKLGKEKPTVERVLTLYTKECLWCGEEFTTRHKKGAACSKSCAAYARVQGRKHQDRRCIQCGHYYHPKASRQKYCKMACVYKDVERRQQQLLRERKAREDGCLICKQPIPEDRLRNNHTAKYCSVKCKKRRDNRIVLARYRARKKAEKLLSLTQGG